MNVQKFFDTLASLYGKANNVKVKYKVRVRED